MLKKELQEAYPKNSENNTYHNIIFTFILRAGKVSDFSKYRAHLLCVDSSQLSTKGGSRVGAANTGATKVLQGHSSSLQPRPAGFLGVIGGERDADTRVVDDAAGSNVLAEELQRGGGGEIDINGQSGRELNSGTYLNELVPVGWATARNLDGLAVGAGDTVTIAGSGGVCASGNSKFGDQRGVDTTSWWWCRSRRCLSRWWWCGGSRRWWGGTVRNGLLLRHERRRCSWASHTRAPQILQCHERGLHPCQLRIAGVVRGEGDLHGRVVHDEACSDVLVGDL